MRISNLDPVSMNDVLEGRDFNALKIYFENETNRAEYPAIPLHTANATLSAAHAKVTDSDITGTIN